MDNIQSNGTCRSHFESTLNSKLYTFATKFGDDGMLGASFKEGKERVQDVARKAAKEWEDANGFGDRRWVTPEEHGEYERKVARGDKDKYVAEKVRAELDAMAQEECGGKKSEAAKPKLMERMERSFVNETPSAKLRGINEKKTWSLSPESQDRFNAQRSYAEQSAKSADGGCWKTFYAHRDEAMKVLTDAGAPRSEVTKWASYFEKLRIANNIPHRSEI